MSYLLFVIIVFLFLIVMGKWILFIILSPLIIKNNKIRYNQALRIAESDKQNIFQQGATEYKKTGLVRKAKALMGKYLQGFSRYMQFRVSYIPSHHIRNFIYKKIYLVRMDRDSVIYFGSEIRGGYFLKIGSRSIIGDNAILDARRGGIEIGENVQLGSGVRLWTGSHDHDDPWFRSTPMKRGPIKIGNRAWLGPGVTVLHSVTIGEGAVIAAGAVVTKDVEPFSIMGGIPAKKIGERTHNLQYNFSGSYVPFY